MMIKLNASTILIVLLFCFQYNPSHAQFGKLLNKIKNQTIEKTSDKVAEKASDKISDEISEEAEKGVDSMLDSIFNSNEQGDQYSDSLDVSHNSKEMNQSIEKMMAALNQNVDLPDSYDFDIRLEIEISDDKNDVTKMDMLLHKSEAIFGIQNEESRQQGLMVMDMEQDVIAIYDEDKKTVQALPNMMGLGKTMAKSSIKKDAGTFTFEKTSITKNIAGYETVMYNFEDDEVKGQVYVAENFPIDWKDTMMKYGKEYLPQSYLNETTGVNGFMLFSESTEKKNGKKSYWKTTLVDTSGKTIKNSDYQKIGIE